MTRILIVQGHPDPSPDRFCRALAAAYAEAAHDAGHEVRLVELASLDFPLLRSQAQWNDAALPSALDHAQQSLGWAQHLVLVFPLWLGPMPALVKAFLEQVLRPGFAIEARGGASAWRKKLAGRSARLVVTMGMPASVYRWFFLAHGVRGLERNVLAFCGFGPVRRTLIGLVEGSPRRRDRWLARMRQLGRRAR